MICIYHSRDLDGFSSAAIVRRKYPEVKLVGFDYGQDLQFNIGSDDEIIMVDVSMPMYIMEQLSKQAKGRFTWIDHHISAMNDYEEYMKKDDKLMFLTPVLENGFAACEGAWKFMFPSEPTPYAIQLLGEYDTWRNGDKDRWDNEVMPFQLGMRMICDSPESFPQSLLNSTNPSQKQYVQEIIAVGKTLLKYQTKDNENQCKKAFEIEFQGKKAICLNSQLGGSNLFKSVYDKERHDLMMCFQFNGTAWNFSLYTDKEDLDLSKLAKRYGGGGHKKAAGFLIKDLRDVFLGLIP